MTKTDELKLALRQKGLNYVGTRGNTNGPISFVGEAPGAEEDQQGVPFCGASGRELDRMLAEAGINPSGCWWTNPYKTRPPDNKIGRLREHGVDFRLFVDQFFEELNVYKPTFIIPLGATPLGLLCPDTAKRRSKSATASKRKRLASAASAVVGDSPTEGGAIGKYRGSILQSPLLGWPHYIIPSFHPAYLFRNWDERQVAVLCLSKAQDEIAYWQKTGRLNPLPERHLITDPSGQDTIDYLRMLLESPLPVSIDIENIGVYKGKYKTKQRNRLPYVIGLANTPKEAICVELAGYETQFASQIWLLIDKILRERVLVGQNAYTHDLPWLRHIGFSPRIDSLHDTIVMHHVLYPELSHKLEFIGFQFTRQPYWKDEGKDFSVKEKTKYKRYNLIDVTVTLECFQAMQAELDL